METQGYLFDIKVSEHVEGLKQEMQQGAVEAGCERSVITVVGDRYSSSSFP